MKLLIAALLSLPPQGALDLKIDQTDDGPFCSISCQDASSFDVMTRLALELGLRLEGVSLLQNTEPVDAYLEYRPLAQALRYVLGAQGLRARVTTSVITIVPELSGVDRSTGLGDAAEVAYLEALKGFPEHELAADAQMSLASLHVSRGNLAAAKNYYDFLVEEHSDSPHVPEALWRGGLLDQEMGNWSEAWSHFSDLLNLKVLHDYEERVRLELARTSIELGNPTQARHLLDALDNVLPAMDAPNLARRLRLRARASIESNEPLEALRLIDQVESLDEDLLDSPARVARAEAFTLLGRHAEASRNYLIAANDESYEERGAALLSAAESAFRGNDFLAVLFIEELAVKSDLDINLHPWNTMARDRLGILPEQLSLSTTDSEIARAENLIDREMFLQAFGALEPLFASQLALPEEQRVRITIAYAKTTDALDDFDSALDALRTTIGSLRDIENRRRIYVIAGDLLQNRGRYDEAIAAYEGRL